MGNRDNPMNALYSEFRGNPTRSKKSQLQFMYVRTLTELALNRFKWEGLPDSIDVRFMEIALLNRALIVFFKHEETGRFLALRGSGAGRINLYENHTEFQVVSPTFSRVLRAGSYNGMPPECVPIWANFLRQPERPIILLQASRLAELDMTIDITSEATRRPFVIACDESERQTFVNLYRKIADGEPAIFGTSTLGSSLGEKLQLLPTNIHPDQILNLQLAKTRLWNETMTLLGINNSNQDKKERLVSDEVSANDSQVMTMRQVALNSRQMGIEQIKKVWPELSSLSVTWCAEPASSGMMGDVAPVRGLSYQHEGDGDV